MTTPLRTSKRRGNILVLSAILMVGMMAMLAFAVDLGYLYLARDELQRSADAAAIAGAWELVDEQSLAGVNQEDILRINARCKAEQYANLNPVLRSSPNLAQQDITVGYLPNPSSSDSELDPSVGHSPNAVRVCVRRTADQNGEVPFFIAKVLGIDSMAARAEATAALVSNFSGFRAPGDGGNLNILPFALDQDTWNQLASGIGSDNWRWNDELGRVEAGEDGILEVNLYPQGTGSPGNRGTVDIGSSNNSTADIARQIVHGISPADLEHHGGKLALDDQGELELNGDTGISAGVKDELNSIVGKKRIIPIFNNVQGPGNNAQYTIVQFAGIRMLEVQLTGKATNKRVIIQPACVKVRGGIPSTGPSTTSFVYSPVWLVR